MGRTLGLIAGSGELPFEVAAAARESGLEVAIVAVEGNAAPGIEALASVSSVRLGAGELGRLIRFLKESGADEVILAGAVGKREALRDPGRLRLDERALSLLARLKGRGDDALLSAVAAELEAEGLCVVESTRYLADRLTPAQRLAGPPLTPLLEADLALGLRVAHGVGVYDIGQSVVVKEGTVLAVEAVEGTDAAIRRGCEHGGEGAVLVKAAKPQQDLRFDVPAVGLTTLGVARECGLAAIGLEAGRTLVLERVQTLAEADRHGIALVGLVPDSP